MACRAVPDIQPELVDVDGLELDETYTNPFSFEELCMPLYDEMINYARKLCSGNKSQASDIVQDTIEKAIRAWSRWSPDGDPALSARAWLYRIVANEHTKDYHRARIRRLAVEQRASEILEGTAPDSVQLTQKGQKNNGHEDGSRDPYHATRHSVCAYFDLRDHLDSPLGDEVSVAIAHLSDDHRRVIELYYMEGKGCGQIANALGIPKNTVMTRLGRARGMLAKYLKSFAEREYGLRRCAGERASETPDTVETQAGDIDGVMAEYDAGDLDWGELALDEASAG